MQFAIMPRNRKYPKSARIKRMENQLSNLILMRPLHWSLIAFPAVWVINVLMPLMIKSNKIAINEINTCTSSALDSGKIRNLEEKPKLTKKQIKHKKQSQKKTSRGGSQLQE
uniref:Uncharacterized protein n=1 Tax=Amphimedon queenslandica TaxID=400682 RepID=A0A1X7TY97_AMPQE